MARYKASECNGYNTLKSAAKAERENSVRNATYSSSPDSSARCALVNLPFPSHLWKAGGAIPSETASRFPVGVLQSVRGCGKGASVTILQSVILLTWSPHCSL